MSQRSSQGLMGCGIGCGVLILLGVIFVVGSVFWWVLPMSIPVLITQTKKLKAHNKAKRDGRCQYEPGNLKSP